MKRRFLCIALGAALAAAPCATHAQTPPPISPALFSFPGAFAMPANARSASVALANRWLGDGPYDNPAFAGYQGVELSPAILRVSRQDLRRQNRNYDEQPAFFDAAGAYAGIKSGRLAFALYGAQPIARVEDNAFTQGAAISPSPATVQTSSSQRELRGGVAVACSLTRARLGVALEYTNRSDRYQRIETSGAPTAGTTEATFSGGGIGGQAGGWIQFGDGGRGTWELGGAFRFIPELTLEGEATDDNLTGLTTTPISTTRASSWEAGLSARVALTAAFRLLGAFGGHGDQAYDSFAMTRGSGSSWSFGGEYHDARDPWRVAFGAGADEETSVPESRDGVFALGVGWDIESTRLELGVTHRTIRRNDQPNSHMDQVVLSVRQDF